MSKWNMWIMSGLFMACGGGVSADSDRLGRIQTLDASNVGHDDPDAGASGGPNTGSGAGDPDGGALDAGQGVVSSDCYLNPKAHVEIINACTDAVHVVKQPRLPLLLPNGDLPELP